MLLLSKGNHEPYPSYILQTENILNCETQEKVNLPACVTLREPSLFLKIFSQTKHFFTCSLPKAFLKLDLLSV